MGRPYCSTSSYLLPQAAACCSRHHLAACRRQARTSSGSAAHCRRSCALTPRTPEPRSRREHGGSVSMPTPGCWSASWRSAPGSTCATDLNGGKMQIQMVIFSEPKAGQAPGEWEDCACGGVVDEGADGHVTRRARFVVV